MKKTNLDRLLHRYITGQVTEQERIKIEAWLDVKKTREGKDMVLDEEDEERLFRTITANIDAAEVKAFRPKKGAVRTLFSNRWLSVAAALLILAASSYTIWQIAAKNSILETVTRANPEKIFLDDGTIVWLEASSKLTYDNRNEGTRQATLVGEGLFEVAKDPARPFIISCGDVNVKVIGTSFNLKARGDGIELKVLTGKVNLSSTRDKKGVDVSPHEMVVYSPRKEVETIPLDDAAVSAIGGRTEYNMAFRSTSMESVLDRIERKFNVEVVLQDDHVNACRITANFTDQSLVSTFEMIAELLEIDYTINERTVTITGKGCN
jgi:transmembrane sensor